jgi:hypothetical protein
VLEALAVAAGVILVVWGLSELLSAFARPREAKAPRRRRSGPALRVGAVALALLVVLGAAAALAANDEPEAPRIGPCNGSAALCDRRLDEVALVGTHNSMAADSEPGWLFAAQDAGIPQQLQDGVRSLLIDTHYGFRTPRGVSPTSRARRRAEQDRRRARRGLRASGRAPARADRRAR